MLMITGAMFIAAFLGFTVNGFGGRMKQLKQALKNVAITAIGFAAIYAFMLAGLYAATAPGQLVVDAPVVTITSK